MLLLVLLPAAFDPDGALAVEPVKASLFRVLAAFIGVSWVIARLLEVGPRGEIRSNRVVVGGLAVLAAAALSGLSSLQPLESLFGGYARNMGLLSLAAGAVLLVTGADLLSDDRRRERAITALLLGAVFPCAYALAQYAGWDPLRWQGVTGIVSSLGSPTFLGGYLVLVAPFAVYRLLLAGRATLAGGGLLTTARYALYLVLSLAIATVVGLTTIRGALLGLLTSGLVYAFLLARGLPRAQKLRACLAAGLLLGATLALAVSVGGGTTPAVFQRFLQAAQPAGSGSARLVVWSGAVPLPLESPLRALVGFGPEMQAAAFERSESIVRSAASERWDRAHNQLIDTWVTGGALGVLALVFALGRLGWVGWRNARAPEWQRSILAAAVLAALAGHVAEQSFAFHAVVTGSLFWVLLALGASLEQPRAREARPRAKTPARLVAAGVAIVAVSLSLPLLAAPAVADRLLGEAEQARQQGNRPAAALLAEQAAGWTPWAEPPLRAAALEWQALGLRRGEADREDALARAERLLRTAVERAPLDPYAHLRLARHYLAWAGREAESRSPAQHLASAEQACGEALATGPYRWQMWEACAEVSAARGAAEEALERERRAQALRQAPPS